ncbi:MAG: hypothetical protein MI725_16295, partial [Pirellulales bacterium]|nr:hypothetical protein [Pirellulales bacterium]
QHTLVGSGDYWQQGTGDKPLTRWEMNTLIAGKTASYVQVFDGAYLWTDRRLPSGRQVHRLDVELLQSRLRHGRQARQELLLVTEGQGGLAQMLAALLHKYNFDQPRPTQLNDMPGFALLGRWKAQQLQQVWPEAAHDEQADPPPWPEQIPHHVLVLVGQNMFPYVFEYRRQNDAYLADTVAGLRPAHDPLLRYELYEVKFAAAMKRSRFVFPSDVAWKDETSLVLERLAKN